MKTLWVLLKMRVLFWLAFIFSRNAPPLKGQVWADRTGDSVYILDVAVNNKGKNKIYMSRVLPNSKGFDSYVVPFEDWQTIKRKSKIAHAGWWEKNSGELLNG